MVHEWQRAWPAIGHLAMVFLQVALGRAWGRILPVGYGLMTAFAVAFGDGIFSNQVVN